MKSPDWPALSTGSAFTQCTTVSPCVCGVAVYKLTVANLFEWVSEAILQGNMFFCLFFLFTFFLPAWKRDTGPFPLLTCEKGKLVQAHVPRATPCCVSYSYSLNGQNNDPYLSISYTDAHLHTDTLFADEILCVSVTETTDAVVLAVWTISVAIKLRHTPIDFHSGWEGSSESTDVLGAGGRKQRYNLERTGHGESESGKSMVKALKKVLWEGA